MRSTYGTALYKDTGDIRLVSDVLGHKDINTTAKHYAAMEEEHRRIALQDYLTRQFGKAVSKFIFQAKGSGKSGLIGISRCGQEVLDRTAFEIKDGDLLVRFEVGFPANGRTINAFELRKILFEYLPEIADRSLYYKNLKNSDSEKEDKN